MKNFARNDIFLLVCLLFFTLSSPSFAWRITKELQNELTAKKAALAQHPNDPATMFDLAITYGYTNNLIDGLNMLKKIHEIDPTYREKALCTYINKVTENPSDWKLRFRLAFVYYFNDNKKEAMREFYNVLKIDPYNVWAYGYLALLAADLGDIDKGIELTKQGLKIDSNVAALHLLLGEGYLKKGDSWGGWAERMEAVRLKAMGY